jgi:hypothetical protein
MIEEWKNLWHDFELRVETIQLGSNIKEHKQESFKTQFPENPFRFFFILVGFLIFESERRIRILQTFNIVIWLLWNPDVHGREQCKNVRDI